MFWVGIFVSSTWNHTIRSKLDNIDFLSVDHDIKWDIEEFPDSMMNTSIMEKSFALGKICSPFLCFSQIHSWTLLFSCAIMMLNALPFFIPTFEDPSEILFLPWWNRISVSPSRFCFTFYFEAGQKAQRLCSLPPPPLKEKHSDQLSFALLPPFFSLSSPPPPTSELLNLSIFCSWSLVAKNLVNCS